MYAFKGTNTYEIMKFSDNFRSWFCNDSVQEGKRVLFLVSIRC